MTEDQELQAKIAALTGAIGQAKQQQQQHPHSTYPQASHLPARGRGRWSPYNRGGRAGYHASYKNRSLVLGGLKNGQATASPSSNSEQTMSVQTPSKEDFVTTRGRGKNQLMSKEAYEREVRQKEEQKKQLEEAKTAAQSLRILVVEGIKFMLREDGSKLIRLAEDETNDKQTPQVVTIAGVEFHRTKSGNLVRIKPVQHSRSMTTKKNRPQCASFTKHGNCPHGPACKFSHDPEKVAICKTFLHKGECPSGEYCDLSHDPTYHRVPACTHFLRGNCTNKECRYPHIHVSPTALVCKPFATLGYCAKGPQCLQRHVVECADYSNTGFCAARESGKCQLPHIDRAALLRMAADRQNKTIIQDESDSDDDGEQPDGDMKDVDSEEAEEELTTWRATDDEVNRFAQQHDYIPFS